MNQNPVPSPNIILTPERLQHLRQGLRTIEKMLPDVERMKACGTDCQEIADMVAHLQVKINNQIHNFGGPK